MKGKVDEVLGHVQRSINNLSRLFATRNERGVCVLDPELAGTVCTGLLTNLGLLQRLVDETTEVLESSIKSLEALAEENSKRQREEITALRERLQRAEGAANLEIGAARAELAAKEQELLSADEKFKGNVRALQVQLDWSNALLDEIRRDQKKPKKDRKTVLQLEQELTKRLGLAVADEPPEDDEEPS